MDIKEQYFEFVKKVISFTGQKKFDNYLKIAENPLKKIKHLESITSMIITIIILNFILEVIPALIASGCAIISNYLMLGTVPTIPEIGIVIGMTLFAGVILVLILGIYAILEFIFAKIFGGVGSFKEHLRISYGSYLTAYILAIPITILSAIIGILSAIPVLNVILCVLFLPLLVLGIIELVIGLYGLYIKYVMVKELHNLDQLRAIFTIIGPYVLLLIITILIVITIMVLGISLASLGIAGLN